MHQSTTCTFVPTLFVEVEGSTRLCINNDLSAQLTRVPQTVIVHAWEDRAQAAGGIDFA